MGARGGRATVMTPQHPPADEYSEMIQLQAPTVMNPFVMDPSSMLPRKRLGPQPAARLMSKVSFAFMS